jgi:hypothetical protein
MTLKFTLAAMALLGAAPAHAFFIDGDGHYALRGETETKPSFSEDTGTYQAIEQSFRLRGEARLNDLSGMFLEFRLFDKPKDAYLGDKAQERPCPSDDTKTCRNQDTSEPRNEPYIPYVTKAYMQYAFDYCILEAGRRGRSWGLGIFLDEGNDPFDRDASVFDGVTCKVNIQKTQTLGFSVGYDKLSETGDFVDPDDQGGDRAFGANDVGDDIDQYFFTIKYDDRKANAGSSFTKQVGVYFAQISSKEVDDGGSATDLKFLDLYTGFYFADLAFRNEILFRMGKSADPNFQNLGGLYLKEGASAKNKLDSIGMAGSLEWTLSRSGEALGPAVYNEGNARRHLMFLTYAYAPGDSDGYLTDTADGLTSKNSRDLRDDKVEAMAFHRNYKPALILFNGRPEAEAMTEDGTFSATRLMNATVFTLGYRYESQDVGDFETKFVTGYLNEGIHQGTKSAYALIDDTPADDGSRPAGFYGSNLGLEFDFSYTYHAGRDADVGLALGAAAPGKAWQTHEDRKPVNDFLVQSFLSFYF